MTTGTKFPLPLSGVSKLRLAAKVDRNQPEIVEALRLVGATVQPLHAVGKGCPDLAVGFRGVNYLIECKDGEKSPSRRVLTPDQVEFHTTWRGQIAVANSVKEALQIIGAWRGEIS